MSPSGAKRPPAYLGWLMIALSTYPLLAASGVAPIDPEYIYAPMWVFGLCGLVLMIGGCMILLGHHSRLNDGFAAVICVSMGTIGAWISLYSPTAGFSGGIPFLPAEQNVKIARALFGVGSVICFMIAAIALRRAFRHAES